MHLLIPTQIPRMQEGYIVKRQICQILVDAIIVRNILNAGSIVDVAQWTSWWYDWWFDWLIDWLIDWLTDDWLIDWLIDWMIDWLIDKLTNQLIDQSIYWFD